MTAVAFLPNHVEALSERYEVHLVANADPQSIQQPQLQRAVRIRAPIVRNIAPIADVRAVLQLIGIFRRGAYSAVHSLTPKAGLLCAIAAFIARVPVRVHTYTGQVWATRKGLARGLLKALDRLIARLDTHLIVDSLSQRDFLRAEGVLGRGHGIVLAQGSVCGVDPLRFRPDPGLRAAVRNELAIPPAAIVFVYVGRLTREKGVLDLARAFAELAARCDNAWLLLVGPDEAAITAAILERCGRFADRVRPTGHSSEPERYLAASDVFCLPSHREGFGSVIIEAAASGVPAIGSRIYGITDAIEDGATGLLVPAGDVSALAAALHSLAADEGLRQTLARKARERALSSFAMNVLTNALLDFYATALTSGSTGQGARSSGQPPL